MCELLSLCAMLELYPINRRHTSSTIPSYYSMFLAAYAVYAYTLVGNIGIPLARPNRYPPAADMRLEASLIRRPCRAVRSSMNSM